MRDCPNNWLLLQLSEIIQIQKGKKPSGLGQYSDGRVVPYINIAAFETKKIAEYAPEQNIPRCEDSDTLLVWDGARAGLSGRGISGYIGSTLAKITSDIATSDYLFYFINSKYDELNSNTKGVRIPHINPVFLNTLDFPLPPTNEQTRIVEKLDELLSGLDAGVAELKAAQQKLVQYRQSLLKAAVEGALTADWRKTHQPEETGAQLLERILKERRARWEAKQLAKYQEQGKTPPKDWQNKYPEPVKPDTSKLPELPKGWVWASLEQISEIQGGIQKQPSRAPIKNKFPFLRVANVARGLLKLDEIHEIELFDGELERLALEKGDILIVEGNGSLTEIGRCALWDGSIPNAVHQNHLIRARSINMRCEFVEAWLNSLHGIEKLTKLAATTSGLYTLSVGKISKIPIPVPPVSEQAEAVFLLNLALEEHERQNATIKLSIKQSAAQRKNILKAAFSGQLVPQDPNDEPASMLLERIRNERKTQIFKGSTRTRKFNNA